MLTETTRTCATCPLATHIDRDRYKCSAVHNHHSTQVVRGHWEATKDCDRALAQAQPEPQEAEDTDADYVMQLEASLEKAAAQITQQEEFSQVAKITPSSIEVDSIKLDSYRIWSGASLLGTMRRTSTSPRLWAPTRGFATTSW